MCPAKQQERLSFRSSDVAPENHCVRLFTTDLHLSGAHVESEAREDSWAWVRVQREGERWRFAMRRPLKWGTTRAEAERSRGERRLLTFCPGSS